MTPRLPLGSLEEAARDPSGFRERMVSATNQRFRYSYFNALRHTIQRFHNTREDVALARAYLNEKLSRFASASRRADVESQFSWYVGEYQERRGWVTYDTLGRIVIPRPSWAPTDLVFSGEVSRVDLVPSGGYAGWIFKSGDIQGWRQEVRMPLIQDALARELGRPLEEVMVGVYGFQGRVVEQTVYSTDEVHAAFSSLEALAAQLGLLQ